jgi:hypothetical protein
MEDFLITVGVFSSGPIMVGFAALIEYWWKRRRERKGWKKLDESKEWNLWKELESPKVRRSPRLSEFRARSLGFLRD